MSNTHATLKLTSNIQGECDLVVKAKGMGVGYLALTTSFVPALLIVLSSDRRANPTDITPSMQTMSEGIAEGLFARRGWCGDFLLEQGSRIGSRLWLLERAKRNSQTTLAAQDYAQEALEPIAKYHNAKLALSTSWQKQNKNALSINIKVNGENLSVGKDL